MADVGHVLGGRYHLAELVGQGGMATIYRARDTKLGRDVAIKVLRGEYGSDVSFLARFQREAQAAAQLNHPNVVAVFDYGQDPVGPYIVMELVTGGDLAGALKARGPLPPTVAASIAQQIADALDAAHARGIVHRDIKPSNVLLSTGGRVKVADFGIAQAFTDAQLTMTGVTMGSVHYFSPEQARGDPVGFPSDIYSMGLVLYEMLTGQRAYTGGSAAEVAMARLSGRIPTPAAVRPDVPMALDAIVRWALQPDPRARPPASELSAALGRFLADPYGTSSYAPTHTPPPTPVGFYAPVTPDQELSAAGRIGWVAALIGLFVLVLAGVLLFLVIVSGAGGVVPTKAPLDGPTAATGSTTAPRATPFGAPRFVDLTIATARTLAARVGLLLEEESRKTDEAPPGTVIEQVPGVGEHLLPGSSVHVLIAQAADTVAVPDVRGETEENAINDLIGAGLLPGGRFRAYSNDVPKDLVVRTDPRTSTDVASGTTVAYYLSRGPRPAPTPTVAPTPVLVGNYRCVDLDHARQQIEDAGMSMGSVDPPSPKSDGSWLVQDQDPAAGAEVEPGTTVHLSVSDPAEPCT
jgi:eukaryotic-like serine/threonine-protein kinase